MTAYKYPYYLTFFSLLIPFTVNLLKLNYVTLTYVTSLLALFFIMTMALLYRRSFYLNNKIIVEFFLLAFYLVAVTSLSLGIGSGGTLIVIFLSLSYFLLFNSSAPCQNNKTISMLKLLTIMYQLHIIYLYIELILILMGYQHVFVELFSGKVDFIGYKGYNHAHFLRNLGFDSVTGLGGMLMGSQSASIVSVSAFIFFAMVKSSLKNSKLWAFLAFGAVLFTSTMTAIAILLISIFLIVYVYSSSFNTRLNRILLFLCVPFIIPIIFYKIDRIEEFTTYFSAFMPAIEIFVQNVADENYLDLLFGFGLVGHNNNAALGIGYGTDFGLMTLINKSGIVLFVLCFIPVLLINRRAYIYGKILFKGKFSNYESNKKLIFNFYTANVVLMDIWFISLVHYTNAVETGGRELFALHIALAMYLGRVVRARFENSKYLNV